MTEGTMMNEGDVWAELAKLRARVEALEAKKTPAAREPVSDKKAALFAFEKLSEPWAVQDVRRDPKFWSGESQVGKKFHECPPAFLDKVASSLEAYAEKQKADPNCKKDNKGKPWYERDLFTAKLARTWAAYIRANGPLPTTEEPLPGEAPVGEVEGEALPF